MLQQIKDIFIQAPNNKELELPAQIQVQSLSQIQNNTVRNHSSFSSALSSLTGQSLVMISPGILHP